MVISLNEDIYTGDNVGWGLKIWRQKPLGANDLVGKRLGGGGGGAKDQKVKDLGAKDLEPPTKTPADPRGAPMRVVEYIYMVPLGPPCIGIPVGHAAFILLRSFWVANANAVVQK